MKISARFTVAALTLLLFGCTSRESHIFLQEKTVEREFISVFDDGTRTSLRDSVIVDWVKGDRILYYSADNGNVRSFDILESGHTAIINAVMGAQDCYLTAVYGASSISDNTGSGFLAGEVISQQQSGTFADAHVSVAKSNDPESGELKFYNVSSLIKFSLVRNDVACVVISSPDSTILHCRGKVKIDVSGAIPAASFPEEGRGSSIKILTGGAGTFFAATLPCSTEGLYFDLFDSDGQSIGRASSTATLVLNRNDLMDFGELDSHVVPSPSAASIGGKEFYSMKKAMEALNGSDTAAVLKMQKDYSPGGAMNITNKAAAITIDLNGCRLSPSAINVNVDSLTIMDSSVNGNGVIVGSGSTLMNISAGSVALKGGRYETDESLSATTKGRYFITGGEFNHIPDFDLTYPYVSKWVNDSTYRVVEAKVKVGLSRYNGNKDIFRRCITAAGAYPVLFDRYATTSATANTLISGVDALVIPGKATGDTSCRAACEVRLIQACVDRDLPILGICYGIQRINKYKGGNVPSVKELAPSSTITHKLVVGGVNIGVREETHSINIVEGSFLYEIYGKTQLMVNTSHNYACGTIGSNLKVVATAPDGIVEGIESTDGSKMYGVQFHPEALFYYAGDSKHLAVFRYLIQKAGKD